ncbi:hypothetical protein [Fluviispira vulneris]|uniref:hypothetical protein n=1 Tax=Fluviispira vulneris TaxID=2763012 RepID=UPI001646A934|nr:hypothetical protein [Fluviispira vulneris]
MTNHTGAYIAFNNFDYKSICTWPDRTILIPNRDDVYNETLNEFFPRGFYFEIYSKNPDSYFLSPTVPTLEESEKLGYKMLLIYSNCPNHEFERRKYTSNSGFCKHCGLFSLNPFPLRFKCSICSIATEYCKNDDNVYFCEKHRENNISYDNEVFLNNKRYSKRVNIRMLRENIDKKYFCNIENMFELKFEYNLY